MNLQQAGLTSTQRNTIRALGNLEEAVDASEGRVKRANDKVVQKLRSTLDQSENNNRLLSDQNARLNKRVTQLEQTRIQLEAARQAEHQVYEERFRALNAKFDALTNQLTTKITETETNLEVLQRQFQNHYHNLQFERNNVGYPIHPSAETIKTQMYEEKNPKRIYERTATDYVNECKQQ